MKQWITLGLAGVLAACASDSRISREEPTPLVEFEPERRVVEVWTRSAGDGADGHVLHFAPWIDGTNLFTAERSGRVFAFTRDRGERQWETDLDTALTSGAGGGEGKVVVASRNGELIALDAENGSKRWAATVAGEVLAPVAAKSGVVIAQTLDGKVHGLSLEDGRRIWTQERSEPTLSLRGAGQPVLIGDYAFLGFASGKIAAFDLKSGRVLWEMAVSAPQGRNEIERLVDVDSPVLIQGDSLYAVAYQGKLIAVDLKSGKALWTRDVSSYSGVVGDGRLVYVSNDRGQVLALDGRTGGIAWKQDKLLARKLSRPAIIRGALVVGDHEGYVHFLSPDDGRFLARYQLGSDPILAAPTAHQDTVYLADQDGRLAALQLVEPAGR